MCVNWDTLLPHSVIIYKVVVFVVLYKDTQTWHFVHTIPHCPSTPPNEHAHNLGVPTLWSLSLCTVKSGLLYLVAQIRPCCKAVLCILPLIPRSKAPQSEPWALSHIPPFCPIWHSA